MAAIPHLRTLAAPASPLGLDDRSLVVRALRIAHPTAMGVLGDRHLAEDVAQEVALVALRKRGSVREPEALDGWLHRVAVRAALREARRGRSRREAERAAEPLVRHENDEGEDRAVVLLADLPARQRAVMTLHYVHDLDAEAIAKALGCPTGTVWSLLSRGRTALRAALDAPSQQEEIR